jgi:hypothetical protein
MRTFVSCSLSETEKYIISILSMQLIEIECILSCTFKSSKKSILDNYYYTNEINSSHLFIGLISKQGSNREEVIKDYKYARSVKIPSLLLIEKTVTIKGKLKNVIRFDRKNHETSVNEIKNYIQEFKTIEPYTDDTLAWFLGGTSLITLIALLSNYKK